MTPELFLAQFGHIADSPNGVQKLRELILDLAVHGKLVSQDPNEGTAKDLVSSAKRYIASIRKKPFNGGDTFECGGEPLSWCPTRLGHIVDLINGKAFKPFEWSKAGLPIVRIQNLNDETAPYNHCAFEVDDKFRIKKGELLVSWSGTPGTSFGAFVWHGNDAVLNQHIFKTLYCRDCFDINFLRLMIDKVMNDLISSAVGAVGLRHVRKGQIQDEIVFIPPFEEQKRIVAKVDQLMAQCDRLEIQQKRRVKIRGKAMASALDALVNSEDSDAFDANWQRIVTNFDHLIDSTETLESLRAIILDLATSGYLSAKSKGDIWKYQCLGECLSFGPTNGLSIKGVEHKTKTKVLTLSATTSGVFNGEKFKYLDVVIPSDSSLWLQDGDILIQRGNALNYVGIAAVYHGKSNEYIYPDLMIKIRPDNTLDPNFLHMVLVCPSSRNYFMSNASGTSGSMPKVNQAVVKKLLIPIPHIEEQKRIVTKVDRLMAICDRLGAQLKAREATGEKLSASFTHHLLAA